MIRYIVTRRKPRGRMYHGPGSATSLKGLSLYHRTNSLRGLWKAKRLGYEQIDIDCMTTRDGVLVASHSFGAMSKEGFRASGVPILPIDMLTWDQVSRLRLNDDGDVYVVQPIRVIFREAARLGLVVALDLKGDRREGFRVTRELDTIARLANAEGAHVYLKADPRKKPLRRALRAARTRGFWVRYNGTGVYRAPLS